MAGMEYKTVPVEFKAGKVDGQYEGYFSIFGNVDEGGDVMTPGAFAKTLAERRQKIKIFYMHDWEKLLGPAPDIIEEDAKGLYAKGRLTLDSFWAGQVVWPLMKDNALNEGSIGWQAVKTDYAQEDERFIRYLREVKLYEISPVPLGMNALTEIGAVKLLRSGQPAAWKTLQSLLEELQAEFKAGARHGAEDMKLLKTLHKAINDLGHGCDLMKVDDDAPADESPKSRAADPALTLERRLRAAHAALALK